MHIVEEFYPQVATLESQQKELCGPHFLLNRNPLTLNSNPHPPHGRCSLFHVELQNIHQICPQIVK